MKTIQNIKFIVVFLMCLDSYSSFCQCDTAISNDEVNITITSIDASGCDGDPLFFTDLEASISINGTVFEFGGVPNNTNTPVSGANEGCNGGNNTINIGPSTAGSTMVTPVIEIWEEDGCGACSYGTGTFCNNDADHDGPTSVNVDISQPTGSFSLPGSCFTYNYTVNCPAIECLATYEGTMEDICAATAAVFTFTMCDVVPGGGGTGGVAVDLDLYLYAPGGNPVGGAPGGYVPNPTAGTNGQFPHPNTDIAFESSTFDVGQICTATLPAAALPNPTCDPYIATYFLVPYDYTYDLNPDPLVGDFGFYPANIGGGSGADENLCQPIRLDIMVWPDGFTINEISGTCDGTASMVEVLAADGTVCVSDMAAAAPSVVCPATTATDMFVYSFTATDLGLDMAPTACQPAFSGSIDVTCTTVCCEVMNPTTTAATICEGDAPLALMAAPADATCTTTNWFSDAGGTTMVGTGPSFIPTDTGAGTYTYYAQCVDGSIADCESMLIPADFVVNALPAVTLATPALACVAGAQPLNPSPAGGVYSGTGAAFVTGDAIDGKDLTVGVPYNLTYTYTSPEGCIGSATISFTFTPDCDADGGAFPSTGP